jgi:hypothetical protein
MVAVLPFTNFLLDCLKRVTGIKSRLFRVPDNIPYVEGSVTPKAAEER